MARIKHRPSPKREAKHKSWCWSLWTPVAVTGAYKSGKVRTRLKESRCNCGARQRAKAARS